MGSVRLLSDTSRDHVAQEFRVGLPVHRSGFSVYPSGWSRAGENIAAGYGYTSVVQGWIDSPGHRANMLGDYTHIGIGYYSGSNCYRTYFVQNFAKY